MNEQTNNNGSGPTFNHGLNPAHMRSQALAGLIDVVWSAKSENEIKEATQKCISEVGVQHASSVNITVETAGSQRALAGNGRPMSPPQLQFQQVPPAASPPDFSWFHHQGLKFQLFVCHFLLVSFSLLCFQLSGATRSFPHSRWQQPSGLRCSIHANKACPPPSAPHVCF